MALLNLNWQSPHHTPFLQKKSMGLLAEKKLILYEEGCHRLGVQTSKLQQSTETYSSQQYRVV